VPQEEGIPDGLTVDKDGFVWSAQWYGSCIVRYDPDGKIERRIATPAKQTSSLAFGGDGFTDIFITTAARRSGVTSSESTTPTFAPATLTSSPGIRKPVLLKMALTL